MSEYKQLFSSYQGLLIHFGNQMKPEQKDMFLAFLEERKIHYYILTAAELELSIAVLLQKLEEKYQQKNFTEQPVIDLQARQTDIPENILFFSGFSRTEVEQFLAILRDPTFPRFTLKAAATAKNQHLTFRILIAELRQDRIVIAHVVTLRDLMKKMQIELEQNQTFEQAEIDLIEHRLKEAENLFADLENEFDLQAFQSNIAFFKEYLDK